jgi:peptidoglycan/xylan/chitin deacetylase (PgdA/CDA1 family)
MDDFKNILQSKSNIYLYGGGFFGKTLKFFLEENGYDVSGFITTSGCQDEFVLGRRVSSLNQYVELCKQNKSEHEDDCIMISVKEEEYNREIVKILKDNHIDNYVEFDCNIVKYIEENTKYSSVDVVDNNIAILLYHRIIVSDYQYWSLNISPEIFEKQIKYISENYHVLRLDDDWTGKVSKDEKYVVITFDDGYVDNFRNALPVLEKYNVPATFFVSTDNIDSDKMYWWDELEKIFILDGYHGEFDFDKEIFQVRTLEDRKKVCMYIRNKLKNLQPDIRSHRLNELRKALGLKEAVTDELRCLSSKELKCMAASSVVSIGGHTKSHLSMGNTESKELLKQEVMESKKLLEKIIIKPISVFAYPFGSDEDYNETAEQIIKDNGFDKIVIVKNANASVKSDMYRLPRHMVLENMDLEHELNKIWGICG